jgi:hypothetical protein
MEARPGGDVERGAHDLNILRHPAERQLVEQRRVGGHRDVDHRQALGVVRDVGATARHLHRPGLAGQVEATEVDGHARGHIDDHEPAPVGRQIRPAVGEVQAEHIVVGRRDLRWSKVRAQQPGGPGAPRLREVEQLDAILALGDTDGDGIAVPRHGLPDPGQPRRNARHEGQRARRDRGIGAPISLAGVGAAAAIGLATRIGPADVRRRIRAGRPARVAVAPIHGASGARVARLEAGAHATHHRQQAQPAGRGQPGPADRRSPHPDDGTTSNAITRLGLLAPAPAAIVLGDERAADAHLCGLRGLRRRGA